MRITEANFSAKRNNGIDIKVTNGRRAFVVSIDKENLTFDDLETNNCYVKVYSMMKTCCASCPLIVLESKKSEEDDKEIESLLKDIISLNGDEIKQNF